MFSRTFVTISLHVLLWVLFAYIWIFEAWNDNGLFDPGWWFDFTGHATFGVLGTVTLFYLYRAYALHGLFYFFGGKLLTVIIVADIAFLSTLWELVEILWDLYLQPEYFTWLARAQKYSVDTTIDILVSTFTSLLTMLMYALGVRVYKRLLPDRESQDKIYELEVMVEHLASEISKENEKNRKHLFRLMVRRLKTMRKDMRRI